MEQMVFVPSNVPDVLDVVVIPLSAFYSDICKSPFSSPHPGSIRGLEVTLAYFLSLPVSAFQ